MKVKNIWKLNRIHIIISVSYEVWPSTPHKVRWKVYCVGKDNAIVSGTYNVLGSVF